MQELEKILEEIKSSSVYSETKYGYGAMCVPVGAIERILRNHMNDGWIPVEERLPEDGTYICTLDGELCGLEEPFTGMCGIEKGIWDEPDCVIAWRPLPEPYRPEGSV